MQILVQTPLLRAGEAWLGRVVWDVQAEDGRIFPEAYTCHSNENKLIKEMVHSRRSLFLVSAEQQQQQHTNTHPHLQKLVASQLLRAAAVES